MTTTGKTVVLGIGNLLKGDDGIGVRVIEALEARGNLPADVELVDGGTGGPTLMVHFEGAAALVIVDAVALNAPPGTVRAFSLNDIESVAGKAAPFSLHDVNILSMLELARRLDRIPPVVRIVGVQPDRFDTGDVLTPAVATAVPTAVDAVLNELSRLRP